MTKRIPWNKGIKTGKPAWNTGKKLSEAHRQKVIKTLSSYEDQSGSKNPQWKGGRIIDGHGYIKLKTYTHPNRTSNNYYPEHRLIMEAKIGRILLKDEHVHHINGDKKDNRIENLVITSNAEHIRNHRLEEVKNGSFFSIRPEFKGHKN